jgi:dienelactone hydrolase
VKRAILLSLMALPLLAAEPRPGTLTENVATRADASQTYTLYLPKHFDGAKKVPLLFVFDPRGRGTQAAEIFRAGAEEFGWIILSANGTRSDEPGDVNKKALQAIVPEANHYPVDVKRLYATGFSGTALVAWMFGANSNMLAGVIGVGGREIEEVPPAKFNFAHFGFAGATDFNNRDMRVIDAALEREKKTHRMEVFDGGHRWMSSVDARNAIAWMELMAMKEQRRARDEGMIARELARERDAAKMLAGPDALRRYRALVRTFEGLADVAEFRAAAARLESDPAVQRALEEEAKWDDYELRYMRQTLSRIPQIFTALRTENVPDVKGRLLREFKVAELKRRANAAGPEGLAARRILAAVDSQMSFYLMRQLFARREYRLAAGTLAVANTINPNRPFVLYNLAAAHARLGEKRVAVDFLTKAIEHGYTDIAQLLKDEDFASIRNEAGFKRITENWPSSRK